MPFIFFPIVFNYLLNFVTIIFFFFKLRDGGGASEHEMKSAKIGTYKEEGEGPLSPASLPPKTLWVPAVDARRKRVTLATCMSQRTCTAS